MVPITDSGFSAAEARGVTKDARAQSPRATPLFCFETIATLRLCVRLFWVSDDLLTPSDRPRRMSGLA